MKLFGVHCTCKSKLSLGFRTKTLGVHPELQARDQTSIGAEFAFGGGGIGAAGFGTAAVVASSKLLKSCFAGLGMRASGIQTDLSSNIGTVT